MLPSASSLLTRKLGIKVPIVDGEDSEGSQSGSNEEEEEEEE